MHARVPKYLQIKKEHHYVWANYLRNWSNNKKLWFLTSKGRVVLEGTKMVAKERFFYKVQRLAEEHITCICAVAGFSPPEVERAHLQLLDELLSIQLFEEIAERTDSASEELKKELNAEKENWLENKYTEHEMRAKSIITELAKGRLSVFDGDTNHVNFCRFLGHQFARTKTFRTRSNVIIDRMPNRYENQQHMARISMECRWFINYMIGENFGASLYQTRHSDNYCMLINNTEESFITSDQPVINIHRSITDTIEKVSHEQCDLYYPLTPKYGLVISSSKDYPRGTLKVDMTTAQELNKKVAKNAHIHIFGSKESLVKKYAKFVGHADQKISTQDFPNFGL